MLLFSCFIIQCIYQHMHRQIQSHLFSFMTIYFAMTQKRISSYKSFGSRPSPKMILSMCCQQVFVWKFRLTLFVSIDCNNSSHTFLKIPVQAVIDISPKTENKNHIACRQHLSLATSSKDVRKQQSTFLKGMLRRDRLQDCFYFENIAYIRIFSNFYLYH
jgi:hypothetical protein